MSDAEILQAEIERINDDLKTLDPHIITAFKSRDPSFGELTAAWAMLNDDLKTMTEALRHVR